MNKLALLLFVTAALPVLAQRPPSDEIGFNAEKLYDFSDVDAVSLFNGNLTVTLPLAKHRVSSSLSYQFTLFYNGKNVDIETYQCDDGQGNVIICEEWTPARQSNAGQGWSLSFGRLLHPANPVNNSGRWLYEGPSGDEHVFDSPDHDAAVVLSDDAQPMRMLRLSATEREIEFPGGEIHKFRDEESNWRLKEIRDRFGNKVTIAYTYATIAGKRRDTQWTIADTVGRSHTVAFAHYASMASTWSLGQTVSSMTLDGYDDNPQSYGFSYGSCSGNSLVTTVPLSVQLPDGTSFTFQYDSRCALQNLTLPTRGSVSYTYQSYTYASQDNVCATGPFGTDGAVRGIKTRTISDGVTSRTWEYVQRRGPRVEVDYYNQDPPCDQPELVHGPFYWSRTSVLAPVDSSSKRTRTDHYFNIFGEPAYPDGDAHPYPAANDLPFGYGGVAGRPPDSRAKGPVTDIPEDIDGYPEDVPGSDGDSEGRYLASRVYGGCSAAGDCTNGTLLRSTYLKYACLGAGVVSHPGNCWVESTRVVHEDDTSCGAACYVEETSSDRTGGGLYRTATTRSNIPAAGTTCTASAPCSETTAATAFTAYPSWPAADQLNSLLPWITGTYTEQKRTEGSTSVVSKYQFAQNTGALEVVRALKGLTLDGEDVLTVFGRDSRGNVVQEKSFGGDCAAGATNCTRLDTASCCAVPASGLQYLIRHTVDAGNRPIKSEYLDPASCTDVSQSTCTSVLTTRDVSFDNTSGLVTSARDSAGAETVYAYDDFGRLASVRPPAGVERTYTYTIATPSANAQVEESVENAGGTVLGKSTFEFDGLGRVKRVSTPLANGNLAAVQRDYDHEGRLHRVSQPVERSSHPTTSIGSNWTTYAYDALGRQTSIATPDSKNTTFSYTGIRKRTRMVPIAMSSTCCTNASTVEHYDALGRLRRVDEASDETDAATPVGGVVSTDYDYDPAGRLTTVSDNASTQIDRTFDYDGRGFLESETHPESGTTTYSNYDARGHARTAVTGTATLRTTFDPAERTTAVARVEAGAEKLLTTFSFEPANNGANLKKGKLGTAIRYNDLPGAGMLEVKDTYNYSGPGGALATRTTRIERVSGTTRTLLQESAYSATYDDFLLPKVVSLPTCTANGCSAGQGLGSVTFSRTAGFLTSVDGFAELTYHPSGMVASVEHKSTPEATDTYSVTAGLPRPREIRFSGGSPACAPIPASTIASPSTVCANSSNNEASVTPRPGITHTWSVTGGTITSGTTGDSVTFTAPASGTVTLTVTATDACNQTASSSKSIAVTSAPSAPTITAPTSVCGGSTGNTASVAFASGVTHTWSISGGTITSPTTGDSVTFSAGNSGSVILTAAATRGGCPASASSSKTVPIAQSPTLQLSGTTTITRGQPTRLSLTLGGTAPWRIEWSDGMVQNVTTASPWRDVTPQTSTSYHARAISGGCTGPQSATVTVTVLPPAPAIVTATTQSNRSVQIAWSAVSGASGYRIERASRRDGVATWSTTVGGGTSSYADLTPDSAQPFTYIYYVRTIEGSATSLRGAWDQATTATTLYARENIIPNTTTIRGTDVQELRAAIDALRYSVDVPPAFGGSVAPTGLIRAAHFTALVAALNEARAAMGASLFTYTNVPAPAVGVGIKAQHIIQLREALR